MIASLNGNRPGFLLWSMENGTRNPKSFANAREMFSAMDLEDEAEGEGE
jgi:hypothetical protein